VTTQTLTSTFEEVVAQRSSCRGFLPDPVPRDVIRAVLETAQLAPSWCNTQPWEVHLTSGTETEHFRVALLDHVACEHESHSDFAKPVSYSGVRLERRRTCGWALYESVGVQRGDRTGSARQSAQNYHLFGAPHVAIITTAAELGTYGAVDCGAYVATFLYAAQSVGLGAVAQAALANHSPFVRRYFDIADDRLVLCGISFGYRDNAHPANGFRTDRADLSEVVRWIGDSE
jgi:nitroreductase